MAAREVKLCLLGESGVGKSSLAYRFVHDNFRPSMESTIGASFLTKNINVDGKTFKYQIWDTAGQEKYRALAPMYYRGAAAAIIVYDITRQDTFSTLKSWINELHKHGPHDIVIAVAGNKSDLAEQREVNIREAESYAESVGAIFVETSAKTAANIAPMFHAISQRLPALEVSSSYSGRYARESETIKVKPNSNQGSKKKCC